MLAGKPETEPGESAFLREIESTTQAVPALVEHEAAGSYLADPLFRSGLALAGANCGSRFGDGVADDGLLTAYEANTLDLGNTELVVLSACDSGRGALRAGEGVIGLERAPAAAAPAANVSQEQRSCTARSRARVSEWTSTGSVVPAWGAMK